MGRMVVFSIITAFPALYTEFISTSLVKLARERGLVSFNFVKFSDQCAPKEPIDEPTVGPGPGMILKPGVVERALNAAIAEHGRGLTIFFSPQGTTLSQPVVKSLASLIDFSACSKLAEPVDEGASKYRHIILVCARYEGVDARVEREYADILLSIGDYVLMGGDLPAQVLIEAVLRFFPTVVGNQASVVQDSFESEFLDHDEFGLPVEWHGEAVPEVLRSGDHAKIKQWRVNNAAKKTVLRRFDWFRAVEPSRSALTAASLHIPRHYVALLHGDVLVKSGEVGTTSVTSIDLHDIARTSRTYGIEQFFAVTPLIDQQEIVKTFLDFWKSDVGKKFNRTRTESTSRLVLADTFNSVLAMIEGREGQKPVVITTSAKESLHARHIDFHDQGLVWEEGRPVLFVFGTGQGLASHILDASDYLLVPVTGMTEYNHLSVRSAVAIILDRWMGLNPKKKSLKIL